MSKVVDDGAVEFRNVPKIEPDRLPEIDTPPENMASASFSAPKRLEDRIVILDKTSIDHDGKTQDAYIEQWNKMTDGRIMASMSDCYKYFKQIRNELNGSRMDKLAARLRLEHMKDFRKYWMVSSTCLECGTNPTNKLEGKIIHHYGCNRPEYIYEQIVEITPTACEPIVTAIDNPKKLKFIRAYFSTGDNKEEILQTIELMSGKDRSKIWVDIVLDANAKYRCATMYANGDMFDISMHSRQLLGASYGVRYG